MSRIRGGSKSIKIDVEQTTPTITSIPSESETKPLEMIRNNESVDHPKPKSMGYQIKGKGKVGKYEGKFSEKKNVSKVRKQMDLPIGLEPVGWEIRMPKVYKDIEQPENPKSLKVAFLGAANAGKSTLLNQLVDDEISIVSDRPQTTRKRTQGIMTENNVQLVFLDSPGVTANGIDGRDYRGNKLKFNRELINASWRCLDEADYLLILLDLDKLTNHSTHAEDHIFEKLQQLKATIPAKLIFNKADLIDPNLPKIQEKVNHYLSLYSHIEPTPMFISAKTQLNVLDLKQDLMTRAVDRDWIFPKGVRSDISDYDRVTEAIRQAYYKRLKSYLPYVFGQQNLGWTEMEDGSLRIDQLIVVENSKHVKILVGSQGSIVNAVVQEATMDLRKLFKRKVKLYVHFKVVDKLPNSNS